MAYLHLYIRAMYNHFVMAVDMVRQSRRNAITKVPQSLSNSASILDRQLSTLFYMGRAIFRQSNIEAFFSVITT